MPNVIQIKRSATTATPPSLAVGELAWSENSQTLFVGESGAVVKAIGGPGVFARKADTLTLTGDLSGSGALSSSITLTLPNIVTASTKCKITYNAKGQVTAGADLIASDIPTLTASKVSDFMTQVYTARLDQMAAPTADVSLNSRKITNLAEPTAAQDAATKNYVDSAVQGLDSKASVRCATTASITLSGTQTIDGVAVVAGDRVLVKDQSTASQNGLYVVAAGAWSRATDGDTWAELISAYVFVEAGTVGADTGWTCTVEPGGVIGSTNVTWTQFSGAGQVVAGAGLTKTGNQLDVVGTSNRITVNADSIDIASTYVGQTSITTLGTVATGVWQGTTIAVGYGGLGLTAAVTGLLKGNGTSYSAAVAGTDYLSPSSTVDGGTF